MREAIDFASIVISLVGTAAVLVWLTFGFGCGSFSVSDWPEGARFGSAVIIGGISAFTYICGFLALKDLTDD